jgi:hypothetical protein
LKENLSEIREEGDRKKEGKLEVTGNGISDVFYIL